MSRIVLARSCILGRRLFSVPETHNVMLRRFGARAKLKFCINYLIRNLIINNEFCVCNYFTLERKHSLAVLQKRISPVPNRITYYYNKTLLL